MIDIKRLKAELGLSQKELGAIMGLRQPQVSTVLSGKGSLREEHIIRLKQALGDKINKYITEQCDATHLDNNSINPTNTQARMDPITMDYINTLKEQLAEMTAIVKNQNAVIERLTQKGDDEVLSRRLGAVEKKQDELTDKP